MSVVRYGHRKKCLVCVILGYFSAAVIAPDEGVEYREGLYYEDRWDAETPAGTISDWSALRSVVTRVSDPHMGHYSYKVTNR